jgi:hypothetical protein
VYQVCNFFFFHKYLEDLQYYQILYVFIVENQSTELGTWLNDLNSCSILGETISDVSIYYLKKYITSLFDTQ